MTGLEHFLRELLALLTDPAHIVFEIIISTVFDVLIIGIVWRLWIRPRMRRERHLNLTATAAAVIHSEHKLHGIHEVVSESEVAAVLREGEPRVDGVELAEGDLQVLVEAEPGTQNGVYVVSGVGLTEADNVLDFPYGEVPPHAGPLTGSPPAGGTTPPFGD